MYLIFLEAGIIGLHFATDGRGLIHSIAVVGSCDRKAVLFLQE